MTHIQQAAPRSKTAEKLLLSLRDPEAMLPLRAKCYLPLIATVFIFASGCHKQSPALSPEQPDANKVFDIAQAMKVLYGNYDVKTQTSVTSLPREKSSLPGAGEQQMTVRVLFNAYGVDAGPKSLVLVTFAVPSSGEAFDCHACSPTIGMAVFSQKGLKWIMDASNRAVTFAGEWGKPPKDIQLVQIGPNRHAVEVVDVGKGNGESTAVLQILIPWNGNVNLGLERIIADDDKGLCDSRGGLACYANRRTVTFIPKDKVEYYDLELKLTGTDLPPSDATASRRARKVNGLETLKFENGRYVQISRHGDLTCVDAAVAKRENLRRNPTAQL
jgi:hypothetical protein